MMPRSARDPHCAVCGHGPVRGSRHAPRLRWTHAMIRTDTSVGDPRPCDCTPRVAWLSASLEYQRLWTLGDGTLCLLVEHEDAPRFEICVVRGEDVIRQNRLYARRQRADARPKRWRATLESTRVDRSLADRAPARQPRTSPIRSATNADRRLNVASTPIPLVLSPEVSKLNRAQCSGRRLTVREDVCRTTAFFVRCTRPHAARQVWPCYVERAELYGFGTSSGDGMKCTGAGRRFPGSPRRAVPRHDVRVEVVLPQIDRAAEVLREKRHQRRDERVAEDHRARQRSDRRSR